jgi:hypothetical protein
MPSWAVAEINQFDASVEGAFMSRPLLPRLLPRQIITLSSYNQLQLAHAAVLSLIAFAEARRQKSFHQFFFASSSIIHTHHHCTPSTSAVLQQHATKAAGHPRVCQESSEDVRVRSSIATSATWLIDALLATSLESQLPQSPPLSSRNSPLRQSPNLSPRTRNIKTQSTMVHLQSRKRPSTM